MRLRTFGALVTVASSVVFVACGSTGDTTAFAPGGVGGDDRGAGAAADGGLGVQADPTTDPDGGVDAAPLDAGPRLDGGPAASKIEHVVLIVQENHTFDTYFGRYCAAPAGSSPTCNTGPSCCERAPDQDPSGASPQTLDDALNASHDPDHSQACEASEMNGGKMDRYVTGASCSDARNFAIAPPDVVKTYHDYASKYALADRYFQPIVGASSANDMYFAEAKHVFTDNAYEPKANGHGCSINLSTIEYTGRTTLADLLIAGGHTFAVYAQGYDRMVSSTLCPLPPSDCPAHIPTLPCDYDPADIPFEYYAQLTDNPKYMKDYDRLAADVANGALPTFSYVKGLQYHNEHPGYGTTISAGIAFAKGVVDTILSSPYASSTLVLLTWDEGGGFFDHVSPPPGPSAIDEQSNGTRVPLLALGPFAKTDYVSHVTMEHSSVVKFVEWNFLGATGQLGARDTVVNNLGDLLDPQKVGTVVPAD